MSKSLTKVVAWRAISLPTSTVITYLYLGELTKSIILSAILVVVMTSIHFVFESVWDKYFLFSTLDNH